MKRKRNRKKWMKRKRNREKERRHKMKEEERGVCRYHISTRQETQYEWSSVYKLFVKYPCTTERTENTKREENKIWLETKNQEGTGILEFQRLTWLYSKDDMKIVYPYCGGVIFLKETLNYFQNELTFSKYFWILSAPYKPWSLQCN